MSIMWADDIDTDLDTAEYDDSEGELLDAESDYDESRSAAARRRRMAQQRRVALATRRRQAMARRRPGMAVAQPSPQQRTVAAIRNLDLETKVTEDTHRSAIIAQNKRMSRSEYAAVVGAATNQFIESFDAPDNPYFRAALRFSPLLLLSPARRSSGVESIIRDPRFIGGAAVAAIVFAGDARDRSGRSAQIEILGPNHLVVQETDTFVAEVKDKSGKVVQADVIWESSRPDVATIDPTGVVSALSPDTTVITAKAGDITRRVRLRVSPANGGGIG
jgi:hypothetical protein